MAIQTMTVLESDGVSKISVTATPPSTPQTNDLWVDIS